MNGSPGLEVLDAAGQRLDVEVFHEGVADDAPRVPEPAEPTTSLPSNGNDVNVDA